MVFYSKVIVSATVFLEILFYFTVYTVPIQKCQALRKTMIEVVSSVVWQKNGGTGPGFSLKL
jgi:hypothetical protein